MANTNVVNRHVIVQRWPWNTHGYDIRETRGTINNPTICFMPDRYPATSETGKKRQMIVRSDQ